jgi:hypothetical protein
MYRKQGKAILLDDLINLKKDIESIVKNNQEHKEWKS